MYDNAAIQEAMIIAQMADKWMKTPVVNSKQVSAPATISKQERAKRKKREKAKKKSRTINRAKK